MKKINFKKISVLALLFVLPIVVDSQVDLDSNVDVRTTNTVDTNSADTRTTSVSTTSATVNTTTTNSDTTINTTASSNTSSDTSLQDVTNAINNIKQVSKTTESQIRAEIKSGIDNSIINIREQVDIEAYELQRIVDQTRNSIYQDLENTFGESLNTVDSADINSRIDAAVNDIEASLESVSGVDVDFSSNRRSINDTLLKYDLEVRQNQSIIDSREGDLITKDSDGDGLSDYDEKNIYNTDPNDATTVDGELSDGQKVSASIDPTSENQDSIRHEDPRQDSTAFVSDLYSVNKVEIVVEDTGDSASVEKNNKLRFEGTALPNSYVTLYIFSTPIIVTVKTDQRGDWEYTLDRELEDGSHEMYVATVDNSGKILARSNSVPFTKTAQAAVLGAASIGNDNPAPSGNFFQDNFILIIFGILLLAILLTLIFTGNKKVHDSVDEMKNSV